MRILNSAKKRKKRNPLGFIDIHFVAKYHKIEAGPFGAMKKKSHSAEKKLKTPR